MGVSPPLIMTFAILMPLISANFMFRLIMMRPHVLSIAFLLVTCALLSKGTLRFRMIAAGVISFIYAWTYSNPQFIVIPAFVFALAYCKRDSAKVFWIPAAAFGGVMLGPPFHDGEAAEAEQSQIGENVERQHGFMPAEFRGEHFHRKHFRTDFLKIVCKDRSEQSVEGLHFPDDE